MGVGISRTTVPVSGRPCSGTVVRVFTVSQDAGLRLVSIRVSLLAICRIGPSFYYFIGVFRVVAGISVPIKQVRTGRCPYLPYMVYSECQARRGYWWTVVWCRYGRSWRSSPAVARSWFPGDSGQGSTCPYLNERIERGTMRHIGCQQCTDWCGLRRWRTRNRHDEIHGFEQLRTSGWPNLGRYGIDPYGVSERCGFFGKLSGSIDSGHEPTEPSSFP
jgi:hypothetical protein